jgi:glucans biosynthesis protein C
MEQTLIPSARRYDLDWLRLIAIFILLFFHTGMWFNTWDWHVKNNETTVNFQYWMIWLHYWRMPLLLFISGAGTYMALGKRNVKQFAGERFTRLFVPLVFGMFVVVPPQIYYEHIKEYTSYWNFYKTVFNFVAYPEGSFSWHHLWFVAYLLVYSLLLIPFLKFLRSPNSENFKQKISNSLTTPAGIIFIPSLFILLTQIVLRPYFPEEEHDFTDLAYFVFYMSFFFFGMLCYSDSRIWNSIGANRKHLLTAAVFTLVPFYTFYFHFRELIVLPWTMDTVEIVFEITGTFLSWFTVITVIAYGQYYLNRPHPWLKHINEGLYPFYILHQTVIIGVGYYVCQWPWGMQAKFWMIAFLTLTSCLLIYFLIIRPFKVTRFLFGMKPKKKESTVPN